MKSRKFEPRILSITSAMATALLASGCQRAPDVATTDVAVCRDAAGVRTADANCARSGGHAGMVGAAAWYYIARGSAIPREGQTVTGGYTTPRAGVGYARASSATVSRGGFGMSAHSGGGGGE